jgi:hypothetical protein
MSCEHLAAELQRLRTAAHAALDAGSDAIGEEEALRRLTELAAASGYQGAPTAARRGPPEDLDQLAQYASRMARTLSAEVEVEGSTWAFALFLYREPLEGEHGGHVVQVSRDRERTLNAVARWVKDVLDAKKVGEPRG